MMKKGLINIVFLIVYSTQAHAQSGPNILFIFCDDHALKAISAYGGPLAEIAPTPNIDRIAKEGMLFKNCLVTNSICGPSRAVVLTGKHSHLNGKLTNNGAFNGSQQTVSKLLQQAGYETAIVGKWHLKSTPTGFDHYEVLRGQGDYFNPLFYTNGEDVTHEGYTTDIITDQTIKWLDSRNRDKPFFMMCQHKAPHGPWYPAIRHLNEFEDLEIPEPDNLFDQFQNRSLATKDHEMGIASHMGPRRLTQKFPSNFTDAQRKVYQAHFEPQNKALKSSGITGKDRTKWNYQRYLKNYLRCVKAVDESVGRLLAYLDEHRLRENTIVIYSSDQGFYLGEHGWFDKRWMYEESLHTPLLIRWPGVIKAGQLNDGLVSNLDFAETFLDVAGTSIPDDMQGYSLLPLLRGEKPDVWRKYHYYHYHQTGGHGVPLQFGITDSHYKLIRFPEKGLDTWEFFDLKKDPTEMTSQYGNPEMKVKIDEMKIELVKLQKQLKVN